MRISSRIYQTFLFTPTDKGSRIRMEDPRENERQVKTEASTRIGITNGLRLKDPCSFFVRQRISFLSMQFLRMREKGDGERMTQNLQEMMQWKEKSLSGLFSVSFHFPVCLNPFLLLRILLQTELNKSQGKSVPWLTSHLPQSSSCTQNVDKWTFVFKTRSKKGMLVSFIMIHEHVSLKGEFVVKGL